MFESFHGDYAIFSWLIIEGDNVIFFVDKGVNVSIVISFAVEV